MHSGYKISMNLDGFSFLKVENSQYMSAFANDFQRIRPFRRKIKKTASECVIFKINGYFSSVNLKSMTRNYFWNRFYFYFFFNRGAGLF